METATHNSTNSANAAAESLPSDNRYLLFRLDQDYYATPLLGVREIVEKQPCKAVPHVMPYCLGVINLRGQISGVIDLRIKLGMPQQTGAQQVFIVFNTEGGLLSALVDQVEAVAMIRPEEIEKHPHVPTKVDMSYFIGLANINKNLVSIIDLKKLISAEEYQKTFAV